MALASKKLAIDLGSTRARIYIPKKGLVLDAPTILAKDETDDSIIAIGEEAFEMVGKSPEDYAIVRPLKNGVIADYGAAKILLKDYIQKSIGRFQLSKPEAIITVSASATSTEKRALIDAGVEAGLQEVYLINNSLAAALGAGLPINEARGNTVVDIGNGTTEIGVYSLGGEVISFAIRVGGSSIDDALIRFMRREHGMQIGREEIAQIKEEFIDMMGENSKNVTVHGQSIIQGQPKSATIKLGTVKPYIEQSVEKIVYAIKKVLEKTPPDLVSDIIKHGVILTGGGSNLTNLDKYLSRKLNVAFFVAQDPELCTIKGANQALVHLDDYRRSLIN